MFDFMYTCFTRKQKDAVLYKLDNFLTSLVFLTAVTKVEIGSVYSSDHNPIMLDFVSENSNMGRI